ncbi:hypothetical protein CH306_22960 [Rhodococcus sp. 15-725-2-2b]|nr:hypothetical protein CH277_04395 [Rhodococcus sp. 06-469-3-2]OZD42537.1 hypothetical protein CH264_21810 [Rhodococcus sp. 06-1477-1A]OZE68244.1 hypothetical protein CH306_22960 [Rhodococcus sp. 15-725-2-2b]
MADSIPMGGGKKVPLDTDTSSQVFNMATIVEQMNLLDETVSKSAALILRKHEKSENAVPSDPSLYEQIACQIVKPDSLKMAHGVLMGVFNNRLGNKNSHASIEYRSLISELEKNGTI